MPQLELLLRGELLQIDGWQHERRGVVCAAGVAGGRAVGRRLDISHDGDERSKAAYRTVRGPGTKFQNGRVRCSTK